MSAFSDEMDAVALELLTEFGEAITFTRTTYAAYSPATGSKAVVSTSTFSGYAVPVNYDSADRDREDIKQGDVKVYVNAVSTEPLVGDQVALDSVNYKIMDVRKYVINSNAVMYEIQLRI